MVTTKDAASRSQLSRTVSYIQTDEMFIMLKNEINSSYLTKKDKRPAGHILYLQNSKLKRNHTFILLSERNYSKVFKLQSLFFFKKERFVVLIFFVSNLVEIAEGYEEEVKKLKDVKILQIDG